jgi:hypothetical protein
MTITRLFMLAGALLLAACTDDGGTPTDNGKISIVEWATEMARAERPDTIQDKFAIVEDTTDPNAFAGVIEIAKEQKAAEAAKGDY